MEYHVAVRTYQRPAQFQSKTLAVLRAAGMEDLLTVFVGSDLEEYKTLEPDLRYVQVRKGGQNAIADICTYYPPETRILFLDDDLERFYGGNLRELTEEGFYRADVWGFGFITNTLWLQAVKPWAPRYSTLAGCAFAARNRPELITTETAHCDDLVRTVQLFRAGIVPQVWTGAGFKTKYGLNAGGLQSSGDRANTKEIAETLFPTLEPWVKDIAQHKNGLWWPRLQPAARLKCMLAKVD